MMNQLYDISSVNVQILCEDAWLSMRVSAAFDDAFFVARGDSLPEAHDISLRFENHTVPFVVSATARQLSASSSLRVLQDGDCYYLMGRDSVFRFDSKEGRGTIFLNTAFWDKEPKQKQEFLMLSLLWLLRRQGVYGLHGNALVKDGCGIIFVGSTCSGKSTTTLSLVRSGWQYLSDDVTLLRQSVGSVEAIALQKRFSVDPALASHFPELKEALNTSSSNGHKRMIDLNEVYPDRHVPQCVPNVLIFPSIVPQEQSQLIPLDNVAALIELSQNCGGIFVDRGKVQLQMEVLRQLVCQASSYRLLAGRNLYECPSKISDIISEAVGTGCRG
jgi:hypothetical protein